MLESDKDLIDEQAAEIGRLRATLLNILSFAEDGFQLNRTRIATQCRHALGTIEQGGAV